MKVFQASPLMSGSRLGGGCPSSNLSSITVSSSNSSARDSATSGCSKVEASLFDSGTYCFTPILHPIDCASDGRDAPAQTKAIPQLERVSPPFSQRSVGPCRGGSRPDREGAQDAAGQGVPRRSLWRRARALNARIEACWLGDLLATIGFSALAALIFIFIGVL